ncbi:Maf-like protein [Rhizobium lusitanum]|jgi:septum formation protein|uniref:Maf-like protein n=1 Tax=Rhizobium lusitanum TaxID=293958 RepID=UPI0005693930|nr:Maf-like protein [Rhizobium lusitanum]NTJ08986.1 Maf-like protein [Rhizobium lusitanum]
MTVPLILASSSPFRRMLMENAGLHFQAIAADIDERAIEAPLERDGAGPDAVALVLAKAKAKEVSDRFPGSFVIGSDQTMSLGSRVFHKPRTIADAEEHLRVLSGQTHRLNSAIALARNGDIIWEHVSHANLTMRELSADFIHRHLTRVGEKALSSVGAYQLEGEGIQLFSKIDGDYFTIVGLPMLPLLQQLRELGAIDG